MSFNEQESSDSVGVNPCDQTTGQVKGVVSSYQRMPKEKTDERKGSHHLAHMAKRKTKHKKKKRYFSAREIQAKILAHK